MSNRCDKEMTATCARTPEHTGVCMPEWERALHAELGKAERRIEQLEGIRDQAFADLSRMEDERDEALAHAKEWKKEALELRERVNCGADRARAEQYRRQLTLKGMRLLERERCE